MDGDRCFAFFADSWTKYSGMGFDGNLGGVASQGGINKQEAPSTARSSSMMRAQKLQDSIANREDRRMAELMVVAI